MTQLDLFCFGVNLKTNENHMLDFFILLRIFMIRESIYGLFLFLHKELACTLNMFYY